MEGGVTWWRMGKSTRVRSPSEAAGSASRDGAATAAALRPRLEEEDLTKPLPIAEPGKQQRSAAAAAMRAVAGLWERRGSQWRRRAVAGIWGRRARARLWLPRRGVQRIDGPRQGQARRIFQAQLTRAVAGLLRATDVVWVSVFQKSFPVPTSGKFSTLSMQLLLS